MDKVVSNLDPRRGFSRGGSLGVVALLVLSAIVLATVTVPSARSMLALPGGGAAASGPLAGGGGPLLASVVKGSLVAETPPSFWSIDAQTSCASCIATNASVTHFLADSPFTWVRYGQSTDECNISAGKLYSPSGVASTGCGYNLSSLKTWCAAQSPQCHSILDLPGENNNSAEDAAIAKWVVNVVGFQPTYWSIGNEPTGWTHYGIPWTQWRSTDHSAASPMAYAFDVKAAIATVSAVDPGARFIGVEAACSCNTAWFQDVARVDGASISAIAFHNYPSSGSTTETLSQFYAPLASSSNVTSSVAAVRAAIRSDCTRCGTMPLFVNEYNAGPGWAPSNYGGTYPNAVFLAASVAQALRANVTQLTVFNLQSGSSSSYGFSLMDARGTVGPPGLLFSSILRHLALGAVYADRIATSTRNVWAIATMNATTESLFMVNANATTALSVSLATGLLPGLSGTVYRWTSGHSTPNSSSGTIAVTWSLPAQSITLINVPRVHTGSHGVVGGTALVPLSGGSPVVAAAGPIPSLGFVGLPLLPFAIAATGGGDPRPR